MTIIRDFFDIVVSAALSYFIVERYWPDLVSKFSPTHAVDEITSGLHALHLKLDAAVDHHLAVATANSVAAGELAAAAKVATDEATRAASVADKVAALIA